MSRMTLRLVFVVCVAFGAVSCDEKSTPTAATDIDTPQTPQTPVVPGQGNVQITVNPNPVPFSGQPITDAPGCATLPNTWFYEHVFTETGGTEVKFTGRIDSFDGFTINNLTGLDYVVPANGTLRIRSRWCSVSPANHDAQSSFSGADAQGNSISILGPKVRLMAP